MKLRSPEVCETMCPYRCVPLVCFIRFFAPPTSTPFESFASPLVHLEASPIHFFAPHHFKCSVAAKKMSEAVWAWADEMHTPPTSTPFESFASPLVHMEASPIHLVHRRTGGRAPPHVSLPLHLIHRRCKGVSGERSAMG